MQLAARLRMAAAGRRGGEDVEAIPLAYSPSYALPWTDVSGLGADSATTRARRTARFGQSGLKPCFSGTNQIADLPNAYTIAACYIEYSGTLYQAFFGGSASKVVNPGDWVEADAVAGLTLPDDTNYYVRTHITVASTSLDLPWGAIANSGEDRGEATNRGASATNRANALGTTGLGTTSGYIFGPVTVKGVPA